MSKLDSLGTYDIWLFGYKIIGYLEQILVNISLMFSGCGFEDYSNSYGSSSKFMLGELRENAAEILS